MTANVPAIILGIKILLPEQWSDINLFGKTFPKYRRAFTLSKVVSAQNLTSGHKYFADIVREMAWQTVMWRACQMARCHRRTPPTLRFPYNILRRALVKSGLWYSLSTLSYYYVSLSSNTQCTILSIHVDSNVWASSLRNSGETCIIPQLE